MTEECNMADSMVDSMVDSMSFDMNVSQQFLTVETPVVQSIMDCTVDESVTEEKEDLSTAKNDLQASDDSNTDNVVFEKNVIAELEIMAGSDENEVVKTNINISEEEDMKNTELPILTSDSAQLPATDEQQQSLETFENSKMNCVSPEEQYLSQVTDRDNAGQLSEAETKQLIPTEERDSNLCENNYVQKNIYSEKLSDDNKSDTCSSALLLEGGNIKVIEQTPEGVLIIDDDPERVIWESLVTESKTGNAELTGEQENWSKLEDTLISSQTDEETGKDLQINNLEPSFSLETDTLDKADTKKEILQCEVTFSMDHHQEIVMTDCTSSNSDVISSNDDVISSVGNVTSHVEQKELVGVPIADSLLDNVCTTSETSLIVTENYDSINECKVNDCRLEHSGNESPSFENIDNTAQSTDNWKIQSKNSRKNIV